MTASYHKHINAIMTIFMPNGFALHSLSKQWLYIEFLKPETCKLTTHI